MLRNFQKLLAALAAVTITIFVLLPVAQVGALEVIDPSVCQNAPNPKPAICQPQSNDTLLGPDGVLTKTINIISLVVGVAAVITIILAGIRFMTSMGDPAKVSQARMAIIYAGVGLVVVALAQIIVTFILSKAG